MYVCKYEILYFKKCKCKDKSRSMHFIKSFIYQLL